MEQEVYVLTQWSRINGQENHQLIGVYANKADAVKRLTDEKKSLIDEYDAGAFGDKNFWGERTIEADSEDCFVYNFEECDRLYELSIETTKLQ